VRRVHTLAAERLAGVTPKARRQIHREHLAWQAVDLRDRVGQRPLGCACAAQAEQGVDGQIAHAEVRGRRGIDLYTRRGGALPCVKGVLGQGAGIAG